MKQMRSQYPMQDVRTKSEFKAREHNPGERPRRPWFAGITAVVVLTALATFSAHAPSNAMAEFILPLTALLATASVALVWLKLSRRS
jgi:hypothetical protein